MKECSMIRFMVVLSVLLLGGCAYMGSGNVSIVNQTWRVVWLKGWGVSSHNAEEGVEAAHFRLLEDGRVEGSGGCNRFVGGYRETGGQIEFSQLASTRRACFSGMEREDAYLNALANARFWQLKGGRMRLYDGEGRLLLEMRAAGESPEPAKP
jgi:heat shock protein HslJ